MDLSHVKKCVELCKTRKEFCDKFGKECRFCRKNKILDDFFPKAFKHNEKTVTELSQKCKSIKEFSDKFRGAYEYAVRHNIIHSLFKPLRPRRYNDYMVQEKAKLCKNRYELYNKYPGAYTYALKNDMLDDLFGNKDENSQKIKNEKVEKARHICLACRSLSELIFRYPETYKLVKHYNLEKEMFSHFLVRMSIEESIMTNIIRKIIGDDFILNSRKIIPPYEIDMYYPSYSIAIEYDGCFWHSLKNVRATDAIKNKLLSEKNIKLLRIHGKSGIHGNDKIEHIKQEIIKNLDFFSNNCNISLTEEDVLNIDIDIDSLFEEKYQLENVKKTISNYTHLRDFTRENPTLYKRLVHLKKLHLLSHLIGSRRKRKTISPSDN